MESIRVLLAQTYKETAVDAVKAKWMMEGKNENELATVIQTIVNMIVKARKKGGLMLTVEPTELMRRYYDEIESELKTCGFHCLFSTHPRDRWRIGWINTKDESYMLINNDQKKTKMDF